MDALPRFSRWHPIVSADLLPAAGRRSERCGAGRCGVFCPGAGVVGDRAVPHLPDLAGADVPAADHPHLGAQSDHGCARHGGDLAQPAGVHPEFDAGEGATGQTHGAVADPAFWPQGVLGPDGVRHHPAGAGAADPRHRGAGGDDPAADDRGGRDLRRDRGTQQQLRSQPVSAQPGRHFGVVVDDHDRLLGQPDRRGFDPDHGRRKGLLHGLGSCGRADRHHGDDDDVVARTAAGVSDREGRARSPAGWRARAGSRRS